MSQAVISCSAHNWAVITLWPQMGCRCDYVLLAAPCLRLLTACCPWCPPPMAPPQTQRQQSPAQALDSTVSPLHSVLWKSQFSLEPSHWTTLAQSQKFQLVPHHSHESDFCFLNKIVFSQVGESWHGVHRRDACRQISGSGLGQV